MILIINLGNEFNIYVLERNNSSNVSLVIIRK